MTDDLARELAYYKRHLDGLAAERISIEHQRWTVQIQLRQKKNGLHLLSTLARSFGARTDPSSMFRVTVLAINSALEMDRTVVFVPAEAGRGFVAAHVAGMSEAEVARLQELRFELPTDLGIMLVEASTTDSPLIARLRETLGIATFVVVPLLGDHGPIGVLVSGRIGGHASLIRSLDHGDVDTFRAISGMLHAVTQNTRLALLEQTERLKAEFYADLAHDFRTPLTLTLGPLSQILSGKWGDVPAPVRERLEVAERNQERLLGLINQILDLVRLEAGAAELRPERIGSVNELVRGCVALFRPAVEARGLSFELSLDASLDARPMLGDREKLERVLFNLLSNALNFTDQGDITVTTSLEGEELVLVVKDTGIGIAEDELPRVFERFRRTARRDLQRTESSGIGLALVKRIAELHQGSVVARSRKGHGSTFTLRIPFRSAASLEEPTDIRGPRRFEASRTGDLDQVTLVNRRAEAAFDASKPIVLYVEDDADLRSHVHDILAPHYNVFLASDGVDGLEKARQYAPDAIVTDQMMPRMGGRELLIALRADEELHALPVVFLTAQFGTEGRVESLDAGADDYLTKPFHEAELLARVGNLIRARRNERQLAELNRRLQRTVKEQLVELVQAGELQRFLPRPVLADVLRGEHAKPPSRRDVTVLATDLSSLSGLGARLDSSGVATITNQVHDAVASICAAHGGVIEGLAGGRLSVLFGAMEPVTPMEAAMSAVRAAGELRDTLRDLDVQARRRGLRGERARGIALASGPCDVGVYGGDLQKTFAAVGAAVQRAAALHERASFDQIVCDDASRALVNGRVRFDADQERQGAGREVLALIDQGESGPSPSSRPPAPEAVVAPSPPLPDQRSFRREGDYWTVVDGGRVFRIRDAKGAQYLARLLARPHFDVHVLELTRGDADEPHRMSASEVAELGLSTVTSERADPLLDGRAKAAYRQRLEDLEEELREAELLGDGERRSRAQAEKAMLGEELAAAVGLGGRERRTPAVVERQRINVTRTIKAVIQKVAGLSPDLGRHLAASVRTGTFCAYAPHPGVRDDWTVSW